MPIKRGNTSIASIYRGSKKIAKVYRGEECVYQARPNTPDWIQMPSGAYINTPISPIETGGYALDIYYGSHPASFRFLYGYYSNGVYTIGLMSQGTNGGVHRWGLSYFANSVSVYSEVPSAHRITGERLRLQAQFKDGGQTSTLLTPSGTQLAKGTGTNAKPRNIQGSKIRLCAPAKYGECIIYDDYTMTHEVFHGIPYCNNGEYGLWDTISNTFYGNSGSGTITGGYDQ